MHPRTGLLIAVTAAALTLAGGAVVSLAISRNTGPAVTAGRGGSAEPPTTPTSRPHPSGTEPGTAEPPTPAANLAPSKPGGAPAGGLIDPASVDPNDPGAVARAVVATLATIDTTTDYSPRDAVERASRWIDPTLLAGITGSPTSTSGQWLQLARHRGYTTATTELANEYGQPANTDTTAYETISYTVAFTYRDDHQPPPATTTTRRMKLVYDTHGWVVAAFLA